MSDIDINSQEFKDALRSAVEKEVEGLKTKNRELTQKLAKVRELSPDDFAKLEATVEELETKLKEATKSSKTLQAEREALAKQLESESSYAKKLIAETALNESLTKAGVAAPLLPFVKAKFANDVSVKIEGDIRKAVIGEKDLSEFFAEWSKSDEAKHVIAASVNTGGGANGGSKTGSVSNPWAKETFNLTEQGRITLENPQLAASLAASAGAA